MGAAFSTPIVPSLRGDGNYRSRPFYDRHSTVRSQLLFEVLDRESRRRELTEEESHALENAMRRLGLL